MPNTSRVGRRANKMSVSREIHRRAVSSSGPLSSAARVRRYAAHGTVVAMLPHSQGPPLNTGKVRTRKVFALDD